MGRGQHQKLMVISLQKTCLKLLELSCWQLCQVQQLGMASQETQLGRSQTQKVDQVYHIIVFGSKNFFQQLNIVIKQDIQRGGKAVLDDTGWKWGETRGGLSNNERKPHEDVFKVLTLCLTFTRIRR